MRRNPETEDGGVDRDRVTVDRTSIFELANALGRTGAGQANLSREFSNGHTAVLRQRSDDRPIGRIEGAGQVAASIHRPPIKPGCSVRHGTIVAPSLPARTALLDRVARRSEEHTSELQSLMRNTYAVFCLK